MKKTVLFIIVSFIFSAAYNQQPANNPFPKTITVTGSAEIEIVPDQIFVNIVLKEYQKKGEAKKNLENIKINFLAACTAAGIPDSLISIASYTGYNNYYWLRKNKKKDPDLLAGITCQVRFSSAKQMDELVSRLDDEATQSFDIAFTTHSRMTEFRRQLKIQAVKAAKEKAVYLTEAIGEKLTGAITVKEPEENQLLRGLWGNSNEVSKIPGEYDNRLDVGFTKIKLRYEVNAVFAIQ